LLYQGVIPIPPARNTAGFAEFLCNLKEPIGDSIFTGVPSGTPLMNVKCCVAHASNEHHMILKWSAGNRKCADASFGVIFGRIYQCQSDDCPEIESQWFVEVEGHRAFRDCNSIQ
jgi:hypothetical protein